MISHFNHSFANILYSIITPSAFHCPTQEKPNPNEPDDLPSPLTHRGHGSAGAQHWKFMAPKLSQAPDATKESSYMTPVTFLYKARDCCVLKSLDHPSPFNDLDFYSTKQMEATIWGLTNSLAPCLHPEDKPGSIINLFLLFQ